LGRFLPKPNSKKQIEVTGLGIHSDSVADLEFSMGFGSSTGFLWPEVTSAVTQDGDKTAPTSSELFEGAEVVSSPVSDGSMLLAGSEPNSFVLEPSVYASPVKAFAISGMTLLATPCGPVPVLSRLVFPVSTSSSDAIDYSAIALLSTPQETVSPLGACLELVRMWLWLIR
jgi:hypothetical protein